jgi:hypothetical protein
MSYFSDSLLEDVTSVLKLRLDNAGGKTRRHHGEAPVPPSLCETLNFLPASFVTSVRTLAQVIEFIVRELDKSIYARLRAANWWAFGEDLYQKCMETLAVGVRVFILHGIGWPYLNSSNVQYLRQRMRSNHGITMAEIRRLFSRQLNAERRDSLVSYLCKTGAVRVDAGVARLVDLPDYFYAQLRSSHTV